MQKHDVVFGIGPAGTGKTYLAVAMAVAALKKEQVTRIILTRPAVEAGEALGFLPGDLQEKITPYLRPLYDSLRDMLDPEEIERAVARQTIKVAPLAYMRGRTLNNAFIILDEAQNSTMEQMFMFLTRLGISSRAVITGDETQIDLPPHKRPTTTVFQHFALFPHRSVLDNVARGAEKLGAISLKRPGSQICRRVQSQADG
jgi:phosphate starvation-inducible PhoH-like protein